MKEKDEENPYRSALSLTYRYPMPPLAWLRLFAATASIVLSLGFSGCATNALSTASADPALRDPQRNSAIRREPRPGKWIERHESFVQEAKHGGVDVLFLGDSITDFWRRPSPYGREIWDRDFASLHAANFGISGDRTQHVLWRLEQGELDGIQPKVVVVMIGTNNTAPTPDKKTTVNTAPEVIEGVRAVVQALRVRLPATKILLLAIFPRGESPDNQQRLEVDEINASIVHLADGKMIRWLDLGPKFLSANGTLPKSLFPDFLHPNVNGYEIWAREMKPLLMEMLR